MAESAHAAKPAWYATARVDQPQRFLRALGNLVLPSVCPVCEARCPAPGQALCSACQALVREIPSPRCRWCGGPLDTALTGCGECLAAPPRPWDHAVTVFSFGGTVREMIHRFKYRGATWLAPFFAERMAENCRQHGLSAPDMVTPVPLHWTRQWQRGYNQAELLAQAMARHLQIPCASLLRREHRTRQQAALNRNERQGNMAAGFKLKQGAIATSAHILLVDDVMTTGATLAAAATALRAAKPEAITVVTAARG